MFVICIHIEGHILFMIKFIDWLICFLLLYIQFFGDFICIHHVYFLYGLLAFSLKMVLYLSKKLLSRAKGNNFETQFFFFFNNYGCLG